MSNAAARILIADDHAIVRQGIKELLSAAFPKASFGEAQDAEEVVRRMGSDRWDILVLDVSLPGESGFAVLRRIKAMWPDQNVLFLSMHTEACLAMRAIADGAQAYVGKDSGREELASAVRAVLAGEKYVSASIVADFASPVNTLPA